MSLPPELCCPFCRGALEPAGVGATCRTCGRFPGDRGYLDFLPGTGIAGGQGIGPRLMHSQTLARIYEKLWRPFFFAVASGGRLDYDAEFERVLAALAAAEGEAVVDLSCGPGFTGRRLAESGRYGRVYGLDWSLERPNLTISSTIGQGYRFDNRKIIFPEGTGLADRISDIVGRTRVRYGRFIDLTHRFRIDKSNFAVRRNELDLTVGSDQTYAQIGYLKFNRNIDPTIEDLRDKEEVRLAGRVLFRRYWSIFGTTVIDLTDKTEDPLSLADGYEPVRHRIGIEYEDDCLELGLTWRRDYEQIGAFRKGSTFALHLALKGLGR